MNNWKEEFEKKFKLKDEVKKITANEYDDIMRFALVFISKLRKKDEEELIKLICNREVFEDKLNEKTIKDYYKE